MLIYGALLPHPPLMVEEIGGRERAEVRSTVSAMETMAERIRGLAPDTIVIFSPHGPLFRDGLAVRGGYTLKGDLHRFGTDLSWEWENDGKLAYSLINAVKEEGISAVEFTPELAAQFRLSTDLDHGVTVPLCFFKGMEYRLVATGMTLLPWYKQYVIGAAIGRVVRESEKRVVVIASGDLSHALKEGGPAGYDPRGAEFDQAVVRLLAEKRIEEFFQFQSSFVEKAGECGFRTLLMLLGVFEGLKIETELLSYEGPFGVGYAVAGINPGPEAPERRLRAAIEERQKRRVHEKRIKESPLVRLARRTVENHLLGTDEVVFTDPGPEFQRRAGTFVTIKKHGSLRGCIGTIFPTQKDLGDEVMHNAIAAAFHDPRFDPVSEEELNDLVYSVDVLSEPEPITGLHELDPQKYGVIVRKGGRTGLLLPKLEGIDTAEDQVRIAKQKAGIKHNEPVELERFEVVRYE